MSLLPELSVSGSYREIGLKIGKEFSDRILDFILDSEVRILLVPFISQEPGKSLFEGLITSNQALYPSFFEELAGISEGSGLPLQEIYLINFFEILLGWAHKRDLQPISWPHHESEYTSSKVEKSCTDIGFKKEDQFVLVHSEDMPINNACRYCWMIDERVTGEPAVKAFCYPGMFPGNAFSWNEHGIVMTVNYIRSKIIDPTGASVPFMCRDLLRYKTIGEIIGALPPRRASCVSINLISIAENRFVNIEVGIDCYVVKEVEGSFYHVNHFRYLDVPHAVALSSSSRKERLHSQVDKTNNILDLIGDTTDPQFPVFRNGKEPDNNSTAAVVLFDIKKKQVNIYLENPALSPNPKLTYPLPF